MEDEALFVFPTDDSIQYLGKLKFDASQKDIKLTCNFISVQGAYHFTRFLLEYLDFIDKEEFVTCRTYQNMCSIAHLNEFKMSPFNPTLPNTRLAMTANQNTVLCGENSFYIVEDNYIPPEPPVKPNYATPEDEKADEAFKKELQLYEEKIKQEEDEFEPDFEISREGETMQATLGPVLKIIRLRAQS